MATATAMATKFVKALRRQPPFLAIVKLPGVDIIGSIIGRDGVSVSHCGVFYTTSMQHPTTTATAHHPVTIPMSLQNSNSGRLHHGPRHGLLPGLRIRRTIATAAEATQPLA